MRPLSSPSRRVGASVLGIAWTLSATLAAAQTVETVRVGNETKRVHGTITEMVNGDIACYLTLKDDKGAAFKEMADFPICQQRALLNRRVALTYRTERVQSPECQGDETCKKTVAVALVVAARPAAVAAAPAPTTTPAARTWLCTTSEMIVFACQSGQKLVSVCAPRDVTARQGYLEYRFGEAAADKPELVLPKERKLPSASAYGRNDPFAGGGGAWLKFRQGAYGYAVYSGIGNWGPNGEKREKAGVLVEQSGKQIALLRCAGRYRSELGPDLFERLAITPGRETFDYPD